MLLGAYIQSEREQKAEQVEVSLYSNYPVEGMIAVNYVQNNGKGYIVCENFGRIRAFGDGLHRSYWMLEYVNDQLQFVCFFTQTDGGSSGFKNTGYAFKDGICVNSERYYNDNVYSDNAEYHALYTDFGQALTAFFDNYNLKSNDAVQNNSFYTQTGEIRSILSSENSITSIFVLQNILTDSDLSNYEYTFSASLKRAYNIFS